jgi:hypothetical protein
MKEKIATGTTVEDAEALAGYARLPRARTDLMLSSIRL